MKKCLQRRGDVRSVTSMPRPLPEAQSPQTLSRSLFVDDEAIAIDRGVAAVRSIDEADTAL